eukprot:8210495-Pyramimonas_sp.AAC.1
MGGGRGGRGQQRDDPREPRWSCVATRQCGYNRNFASSTRCFMCGRDKSGQPDPAGPPDRTSRRPSRPRSTARPSAGAEEEAGASTEASASDEVAKCRRAVGALKKLGLDDNSALLQQAKRDLGVAEAKEKAARTPDDLLRRALDRQSAKSKEAEELKASVELLKKQLEDKQTAYDAVVVELGQILAEVNVARAAVLAQTGSVTINHGPGQPDFTAALGRLETIIQGVPAAILAGNAETMVASLQSQFLALQQAATQPHPQGLNPTAWD